MDRIIHAALPGFPCAWYAPSYKYSAPVFRELRNRLQPMVVATDKNEKFIELKGGGLIDVWTLDSPDAGRGRKYKTVIIDEAAMVKDMEQAWQQSIRPQLTDFRGSAWLLSTPKGIAGYFHSLFQRGADEEQPDWISWQMPTRTNPYINAEEIESARQDVTELVFAQEYLAQFVSWEGQVFRRILDAVDDNRSIGVPVIIGCDWGRTGDYTVFIGIDAQGHVTAIERFRGVEYHMQRARLTEFWKRGGSRATIIAENNSMGGPVVEQLQRDRLPVSSFTTTAKTKAAIIDNLALAFERGVIKIPNDITMIGELQAYESTRTPSGMVKYSAPSGMHDDTVMALAIAWSGLQLADESQRQRAVEEQSAARWVTISSI